MPPGTVEQDRARRFAACDRLRGTGFRPIGGWIFMKGGKYYDLIAADLAQIERIEAEGLFVVDRSAVGFLNRGDMQSCGT